MLVKHLCGHIISELSTLFPFFSLSLCVISSREHDFMITEEAKELCGDDRHIHWHTEYNGYLVGLDMLHALHCRASAPRSSLT